MINRKEAAFCIKPHLQRRSQSHVAATQWPGSSQFRKKEELLISQRCWLPQKLHNHLGRTVKKRIRGKVAASSTQIHMIINKISTLRRLVPRKRNLLSPLRILKPRGIIIDFPQ
jgi:hypothetical protein